MTVEPEKVEKYESYITRLEEELVDLDAIRRRIRWVPLGLLTSPVGFLWNKWVFLAIVASWLSLTAVTRYLNFVRRWYTRTELSDARVCLEYLRHQ